MNACLFVGQAPNHTNNAPFHGRSGKRLAALLKVDYDVMFEQHVFVNVLTHWTGKRGKGDSFTVNKPAAAARIKTLMAAVDGGVVFCGYATARACGAAPEPCRPFSFNGRPAVVIPHPSGVNRLWNDPKVGRSVGLALRQFVLSTWRPS